MPASRTLRSVAAATAAAAALALATGCGSRADWPTTAANGGEPVAQHEAAVPDEAVTGLDDEPAVADGAESGPGDGEHEAPPDAAAQGGGGEGVAPDAADEDADDRPAGRSEPVIEEIAVTVSPTCVRSGEIVTVTFRTFPRGSLAMIIGYADNQPHGAMQNARADDDGGYVWRVVVSPTAPQGSATVAATGRDPERPRESRGRGRATFEVAGPLGCPAP